MNSLIQYIDLQSSPGIITTLCTQNHRVGLDLEGNPGDYLIQPPAQSRYLQSQGFIQVNFEIFKEWRVHSFSRQPVTHTHHKFSFSLSVVRISLTTSRGHDILSFCWALLQGVWLRLLCPLSCFPLQMARVMRSA